MMKDSVQSTLHGVRSVVADLLQRYLEVEEVFQADGATEQEVIDSLRKACCCIPPRPCLDNRTSHELPAQLAFPATVRLCTDSLAP